MVDGISVIMPTYNQAAFIRRAIFSLLQQTYLHWELVIVNDGSVDDTDVSIQQTPYFPLWKFFLVLREFKTWNNEELNFRRI